MTSPFQNNLMSCNELEINVGSTTQRAPLKASVYKEDESRWRVEAEGSPLMLGSISISMNLQSLTGDHNELTGLYTIKYKGTDRSDENSLTALFENSTQTFSLNVQGANYRQTWVLRKKDSE